MPILSNLGMTLNRYQKEAAKNKAFPEKYAIIYPTIGVLNEAGEMAGKIKKWMRGDVPTLNIPDLVSEMGDVLWYLASLATDLNVTLEDVALNNIEKITKRREKNMIKGDGDHRESEGQQELPFDLGEKQPFIGDILDPKKAENDKLKSDYIKNFPSELLPNI